jgi:hypothetical protein
MIIGYYLLKNYSYKKREKLYHNYLVEKLEKIINMKEFNHEYINQCNNPQSTIKEQIYYFYIIDILLEKKKYPLCKINYNLDVINNNMFFDKINLFYNIECLKKKMNISI